jgi:hypothetical protein
MRAVFNLIEGEHVADMEEKIRKYKTDNADTFVEKLPLHLGFSIVFTFPSAAKLCRQRHLGSVLLRKSTLGLLVQRGLTSVELLLLLIVEDMQNRRSGWIMPQHKLGQELNCKTACTPALFLLTVILQCILFRWHTPSPSKHDFYDDAFKQASGSILCRNVQTAPPKVLRASLDSTDVKTKQTRENWKAMALASGWTPEFQKQKSLDAAFKTLFIVV